MLVKAIAAAGSYSVSQPSESTDQERRREDAESGRGHGRAGGKKTNPTTPPTDGSSTDDCAATLQASQMLDSEKVVELLNHAPPGPRPSPSTFRFVKTVAPMNDGKSSIDVKKIDKRF